MSPPHVTAVIHVCGLEVHTPLALFSLQNAASLCAYPGLGFRVPPLSAVIQLCAPGFRTPLGPSFSPAICSLVLNVKGVGFSLPTATAGVRTATTGVTVILL